MNCEIEKLFLKYVAKVPCHIEFVLKKKWLQADPPFLWLPSSATLESDPYKQTIISHIFVSDGLFCLLKMNGVVNKGRTNALH